MRIWIFFSFLFALLFMGFGGYALLAGQHEVALVSVLLFMVLVGVSYVWLKPLEEIAEALEHLANGSTEHGTLTISTPFSETARLVGACNRITLNYERIQERADELASGQLDVLKIETGVLRSGRLSDADVSSKSADPVEAKLIDAQNQMRRLTIQSRLVASGQLSSDLLDESIEGELGVAFAEIVKHLRSLARRARLLADGNLVKTDDEGQGELNAAVRDIGIRSRDLVHRITDTALHISAATEQISAVLREQEFAASHQASSVEETQRTMETLLSSAKKIAESAQTVFKSAEKTQANNRTVADRIGELKSHTERISEILEVIKAIADRSDLLALNASLEGMRAGEAGKGFTLVAAEMRRLAENIKESVSDIKGLLVDVRESALSSVMATEEGTRLSDRTTESALKITLITQQQQSGTEQVTQSMDELSSLINQGVAGTRQLTTASSELVEMSDSLRGLVERFEDGPEIVARAASRRESSRDGSAQRPKRGDVKVVEKTLKSSSQSETEPGNSGDEVSKSSKVKTAKSTSDSKKSKHSPLPKGLRETSKLTAASGREDPPTLEFSAAFGTTGAEEPDTPSLARAEQTTKTIDEHIDALEASLDEDSDPEAS